jgi:ParB/RepB/Spo0J family partition protein
MHYLPLTQVSIGDARQRRQFDDQALADLAESIARNGLLHPIVVRSHGDVEGPATLVAGERRLRAVELLNLTSRPFLYGESEVPPGMIPVNDLGQLEEAAAYEAELTENLVRVDLTWQEQTEAIANLHKLQELRHGTPQSPYKTGPDILPSMEPTAAGTAVRQSIILQRHIAADPDVAKAKNVREALKIVKRKEDAHLNTVLAAEVGRTAASELYAVHHADCREWLAAASPGQFDCILIDPPYGMGADSFGDAAGKLVGIEHSYQDDREHALGLMQDIAGDLFQVAKAESHLYIWCDIDLFCELKAIFDAAGWWVFRTPLINIKREGGRVPWPEHGPRRCYELVLYCVKGKRPVNAIYRDVFESTLEGDTGGHGASKPVEAYVDLLKRSCRPGDAVLDCFAGSGTILEAAHRLKLRATAVEVNAAYYGQCLKRLEGLR